MLGQCRQGLLHMLDCTWLCLAADMKILWSQSRMSHWTKSVSSLCILIGGLSGGLEYGQRVSTYDVGRCLLTVTLAFADCILGPVNHCY
jgi:hypothetical protein